MGSMDPYSSWPLPGPYYGGYPFGHRPWDMQQQLNALGFYGSSTHCQQAMNYWAGICPGYGQIEMWKCDHCGSRFNEEPEKCKHCGSTEILRFDDPGRGARNMTPEERVKLEAQLFGPWPISQMPLGGYIPKQQSVSEAVAEFREEVACITGRKRSWLARLVEWFLNSLDNSGRRQRG